MTAAPRARRSWRHSSSTRRGAATAARRRTRGGRSSELDVLVARLRAEHGATGRVHQVWLDPLPARQALSDGARRADVVDGIGAGVIAERAARVHRVARPPGRAAPGSVRARTRSDRRAPRRRRRVADRQEHPAANAARIAVRDLPPVGAASLRARLRRRTAARARARARTWAAWRARAIPSTSARPSGSC